MTYIIAEIGVNHNGSLEVATQLIDAAHHAGADAVKIQLFRSECLVSRNAKTANYQKKNTGLKFQSKLLNNLELSFDNVATLFDYAKTKSIDFIATPFDLEALDFLLELGLDRIKIGSGDVDYLPLLEKVAGSGANCIVSTGMSTISECDRVVQLFNRDKLCLMHCVTAYPAPLDQLNLRVIKTFSERYEGLSVGWSDHSQSIEASIVAVLLGAKMVEKHITLDSSGKGPDHASSFDPKTFEQMVDSIRQIPILLGSSEKQIQPCEVTNREIVRRGCYAKSDLKKGMRLSLSDVSWLRPGEGLSPVEYRKIDGKTLKVEKKQGEKISVEDFSE